MAVLHGGLDRGAHLMAALHRQKILADAAGVRAEESLRRRIDAQNRPVVVQQHQSLLHAAGDLGKLVGLPLQLAKLAVDLLALAADSSEQRRQLLIGVVVQRMLQIQLVERLDDVLRQPLGKHRRKHQHDQKQNHDGLEHPHHQHPHGRPADGDAQHRPVVQPARIVQGLFQKRGGIAGAFSRSVLQRLADLAAVRVAGKLACVGLCVVQHRAVRGHPGQAEAGRRDLLQIFRSVSADARDRKAEVVPDLPLLRVGRIAVHARDDHNQTRQQNHRRHKHNGAENFLRHVLPSSR